MLGDVEEDTLGTVELEGEAAGGWLRAAGRARPAASDADPR